MKKFFLIPIVFLSLIMGVSFFIDKEIEYSEFSRVKCGRFVFDEFRYEYYEAHVVKQQGPYIELDDGQIFKSSLFNKLKLQGKHILLTGTPHFRGVLYEGHKVVDSGQKGTFYHITTAKKTYSYLLSPVFLLVENKLYKLPYNSRACYRE